jgi:hypothetical protein
MLGGFLLTVALSHQKDDQPDVCSLVYIAMRPPSILEERRSLSQGDLDEYKRYQRTQAQLVKSTFVLAAALRMPGVARLVEAHASDGVAWLGRKLQIDFPNDAELMRIGMSGSDPEELMSIVDAVVAAYMEEIVRAEDNRQLDRIRKLKAVSELYEQNLCQERRAYRDLAESAHTKNEFVLAVKQQVAQERLAAARKELISLKSQLRTLRIEVEVQTARMDSHQADSSITDERIEESLDKDKTVLSFLADIQEKETQRDKAVSLAAADRRPELLKQKNEEIDKLKQAMLVYQATGRAKIREQLIARDRAQSQTKLRSDQERIIVLSELDKQLTWDIETLAQEIKAAAVNNVDLESSKDELDKLSETAKKLRTLVEDANVEAGRPARIRVQERAHRTY